MQVGTFSRVTSAAMSRSDRSDRSSSVEPRPLRHALRQIGLQIFAARARQRRDHEHVVETESIGISGRDRQQRLPLQAVDLVERQHDWAALISQAFQDAESLVVDLIPVLRGLDDIANQNDHVSVARPRPGRLNHGPVQPTARLEDPRCVETISEGPSIAMPGSGYALSALLESQC